MRRRGLGTAGSQGSTSRSRSQSTQKADTLRPSTAESKKSAGSIGDPMLDDPAMTFQKLVRVFRRVKTDYTSPGVWAEVQTADQLKLRLMDVGKQFAGVANLFDRAFFHLACYQDRWQEFGGFLSSADPDALDDVDQLRHALKRAQAREKELEDQLVESKKQTFDLEQQLQEEKFKFEQAERANKNIVEIRKKLEDQVDELENKIAYLEDGLQKMEYSKMQSQKKIVEKWREGAAAANVKDVFMHFTRQLEKDIAVRRINELMDATGGLREENERMKLEIESLDKQLEKANKGVKLANKQLTKLRKMCYSKATSILFRYQGSLELPDLSQKQRNALILRRGFYNWKWLLPSLKAENGRFLLIEVRQKFAEAASEVRQLRKVKEELMEAQHDLNKKLLDRAVDGMVTHIVAVMKTRVKMKKQFTAVQEAMMEMHAREIEKKNMKLQQMQHDMDNDVTVQNVGNELEELKWQLSTLPGVPPRKVTQMDPAKCCMACKKQIVYQEYVHSQTNELETISDVPGKAYLEHLDTPQTKPKHLVRAIFQQPNAVLEGNDGGLGRRSRVLSLKEQAELEQGIFNPKGEGVFGTRFNRKNELDPVRRKVFGDDKTEGYYKKEDEEDSASEPPDSARVHTLQDRVEASNYDFNRELELNEDDRVYRYGEFYSGGKTQEYRDLLGLSEAFDGAGPRPGSRSRTPSPHERKHKRKDHEKDPSRRPKSSDKKLKTQESKGKMRTRPGSRGQHSASGGQQQQVLSPGKQKQEEDQFPTTGGPWAERIRSMGRPEKLGRFKPDRHVPLGSYNPKQLTGLPYLPEPDHDQFRPDSKESKRSSNRSGGNASGSGSGEGNNFTATASGSGGFSTTEETSDRVGTSSTLQNVTGGSSQWHQNFGASSSHARSFSPTGGRMIRERYLPALEQARRTGSRSASPIGYSPTDDQLGMRGTHASFGSSNQPLVLQSAQSTKTGFFNREQRQNGRNASRSPSPKHQFSKTFANGFDLSGGSPKKTVNFHSSPSKPPGRWANVNFDKKHESYRSSGTNNSSNLTTNKTNYTTTGRDWRTSTDGSFRGNNHGNTNSGMQTTTSSLNLKKDSASSNNAGITTTSLRGRGTGANRGSAKKSFYPQEGGMRVTSSSPLRENGSMMGMAPMVLPRRSAKWK
ncbi:unnamed protein product [Amoebophrya sp. A120]|nr:unnamed protein product [Amoebophrya sp. A120]|eukprot:GSA120T00009208001.1